MHRSAQPPRRRHLPATTFGTRTGVRVRILATGTLAVGAAGGALGACSRPAPAHCVERSTGRAVPEAQCATAGVTSDEFGGTADSVRPRSSGFAPGFFAWYYGGRVVNGLVSGGGWRPSPGVTYRSPSGTRTLRVPSGGGASAAGAWRTSAPAGRVSRGGFGAIGAGRFGGG